MVSEGGSGVSERPMGLRIQGLPLQGVGEELCCDEKVLRVLLAEM